MKLYTIAIKLEISTNKYKWSVDTYPSTIESPAQFISRFKDIYAGNGIVEVVILETSRVLEINKLANNLDVNNSIIC